jgi:hypothetical protein
MGEGPMDQIMVLRIMVIVTEIAMVVMEVVLATEVDTEVMVVVIATEGPWVPTEELII